MSCAPWIWLWVGLVKKQVRPSVRPSVHPAGWLHPNLWTAADAVSPISEFRRKPPIAR